MEAKRRLRTDLLAARAGLSEPARESAAAAVADRVLGLPELPGVSVVAAYLGYGDELPTLALLDALRERGIAVLLPILRADGDLDWGWYDGRAGLRAGRHDIPEPVPDPTAHQAPDLAAAGLVVVPGVAFDRSGGRLGRGGGSYDRALARVPPGIPRVGLAIDEGLVEQVPMAAHDQRVTIVVTPSRVIRVR